MEDEILGVLEDCKCPQCGSKKVVCEIQFPLIVKMDMQGKVIRKHWKTGKRLKQSNEWKASMFENATHDEFQIAIYSCEKCDWKSKPYTP